MDSIAAAPAFETSLQYSCGCRDAWPVYSLPEDAATVIDVPCVPEHCQTCERAGMCEARRAMLNYQPVQFSEIAAGGPKKYRRLSA